MVACHQCKNDSRIRLLNFEEVLQFCLTRTLFTLPKSSILYLAGFYNEFKIDGESVNRFVILTTAANRSMADIHDRMPLIIMEADVANWTSNTDFALRALKATPPNLDKVKV